MGDERVDVMQEARDQAAAARTVGVGCLALALACGCAAGMALWAGCGREPQAAVSVCERCGAEIGAGCAGRDCAPEGGEYAAR